MSTHPASALSDLISEYAKGVLLRTPKHTPLDTNAATIAPLRSTQAYLWLTAWLPVIGHPLLKLKDFNVNQFDEELAGLAPQLYLSLLEEKLVKYVARSAQTPREAVQLHYQDDAELSQLDTLYRLCKLAARKSYDALRRANDKSPFDTHMAPIHQAKKGNTLVQHFQESGRVYRRVLAYDVAPPLEKRTPLTHTLDPTIESIECLIANVYELDKIYPELPVTVQRQLDLEEIIEVDLNWRKVALNRKRAVEMELLLANRKKSSRIEQRERKQTDVQMAQADIQRELDDYLDEESGHRRSARVRAHDTPQVTETREERLKRRRLEQGLPQPETVNVRALNSNREEYYDDEEDEDEDEEEYEGEEEDDDDLEEEKEKEKEKVTKQAPMVTAQQPLIHTSNGNFHQYVPPQPQQLPTGVVHHQTQFKHYQPPQY